MKNNSELTYIRDQIDAIDQQLLNLLNQRGNCVLQVAKIKIKYEGDGVEFYRPEREAQVLKKIIDRNKGPLTARSLMTIFRTIMTECRYLEMSHRSESEP